MPAQLNLFPQPRSATLSGGTLDLNSRGALLALNTDPAAALWAAGERTQQALQSAGIEAEIIGGANDTALVTITLGTSVGHAQGYRLTVAADGIAIAGDDAAGAYYGAKD